MDIFRRIAEERIRESMARGEFDNLPNRGKPLNLDQDSGIPEDLRMAYKVLKNAGCLPDELELRKEICSLRQLMQRIDDDQERREKMARLNVKLLKLNTLRKKPLCLEGFPEYEAKIAARFPARRHLDAVAARRKEPSPRS